MYPEIAINPNIRDIWLPSYIKTYIERDIRQIINVQDIYLFQTFIGLCAASHSQELNLASMSKDCGISQPTVKRWISLLQNSFIIYLLKPFFKNFGKRLIKSPKLYFIDSGIPGYLTRQGFSGSMGGAFFEGFIISETLKIINNSGTNIELYFWRSHDGMEIDLIIEQGEKSHSIEIKKTQTPTPRHAQYLERFSSMAGKDSESSFDI